MTARRWLVGSLLGLAALLVAGRLLAAIFAEWAWYDAMGALPLYRSRLMHEGALRGGAFLAALAFALGNLYAVRSSIVSLVLPRRLANLDFGEEVPGRHLTLLVLVVAVVIAVLLTLPMDDWTGLALARFGEPFNELDPYTERDYGFYVYWLPFERSLYVWALVALLVVSAVVVFLYAITPSLRWERGKLYVSTYVRRHLAILAGFVLALVAWNYRLDGLSLLTRGSGPLGAFTVFDHRVAIPLLTGLSLGALVAAAVVAWSAWHGYHRVTLTILTLIVLAGPGARTLLPVVSRWSSTEAVRQARERPYASTRGHVTRRAFGVDAIHRTDSLAPNSSTRDDLARAVSSWDPAALARTAAVESRGLASAAVAWIPSPNGLTASIVQRPAVGAGPWSLTLLDATAADERGRALPPFVHPARIGQSIPAVLVEPDAPAYAVIADTLGRVSAPPFESWLERLAHAWRLQNPRLLAIPPPTPRPRVVFHRDVRERIAAIAPFFSIGPTLQAIVRDDSLYWLAELFVTSNEYPLSEPLLFAGEERRYVRHAATALVQAQTGVVRIIADPAPDPVARSWMRRYPWLFESQVALAAGLASLRPPMVDWATVQGYALVRTGLAGDTLFPRRLAGPDNSSPDLAPGGPTLAALRGATSPLSWSVGVLDGDDRVVGALIARGGQAPRTEWHRDLRPARWRHLLDTLVIVAGDRGLVGRQRAIERTGRVQLVPLRSGFAFVQSFYRWPSDAPPSLAGVAVLDGERVLTGATLAEALGVARPVSPAGSGALRSRVGALYDEMSAAMRRGDWVAFGNAFAALGRLLRSAP